jgi:hypothetical protein
MFLASKYFQLSSDILSVCIKWHGTILLPHSYSTLMILYGSCVVLLSLYLLSIAFLEIEFVNLSKFWKRIVPCFIILYMVLDTDSIEIVIMP